MPEPISTGAMLGSAGIGAVGNLLGGLFSNSGNSSFAKEQFYGQLRHAEQMYALQYRHAMEAEQRADRRWYAQADYEQELQKAMLDYTFKNYNSPSKQAEFLRAAGFNPSAMLGQSSPFGNVSPSAAPSPGGMMQGITPSAMSASPIAAGMTNPFGNHIAGLAESLKAVAEAEKAQSESAYTDVGTEFALQSFGNRLTQEFAKAGTMQLEQDRADWLLSLDKLNLPKKQLWEIKSLINQAFKFQSEGMYYQALEGVENVTERLLNMDVAIKAPYAANPISFAKATLEDMRATIQQKQANAYELTQQGNEVKLRNQLTEFKNQVYGMSEDDFKKHKEQYAEEFRGIIQRAFDNGQLERADAEEANSRINRAMRYNNLPEFMKDVISVTDWTTGQVGRVAGAAGSIYGARQMSNAIRSKSHPLKTHQTTFHGNGRSDTFYHYE